MSKIRKKPGHRWIALLLSFCMMISLGGNFAFAVSTQQDSALCAHHPEHTAECGYQEAVEGKPCVHPAHDENCGYQEPAEEVPCGHTEHTEGCGFSEGALETPCDKNCPDTDGDGEIDHAGDCAYAPAQPGTPCKHTEEGGAQHDEGCGYVPARPEKPCRHVEAETGGAGHDETCGYVQARVARPCAYVCAVCPLQQQIDALPDPEKLEAVDGETRAEVLEKIAAIQAAIAALDETDAAQLDKTRLEGLAAFLKEARAAAVTIVEGTAKFTKDQRHIERVSDQEYIISFPGVTEGSPLIYEKAFAWGGYRFSATVVDANGDQTEISQPLNAQAKFDDSVLKTVADNNNGNIPAGTYSMEWDISQSANFKDVSFSNGSRIVTIKVVVGTEAGDDSKFDSYKITTASPENVTFNLFDYWVESETAHDHPENGELENNPTFSTCGIPGCVGDVKKVVDDAYKETHYYEKGINKDHALVFSPGGNLTGGWNFNTNNYRGDSYDKFHGGPYTELVQRKLGSDGYPVLNLTQDEVNAAEAFSFLGQNRPADESLAYLFSTEPGDGKKIYQNVTGLLKTDPQTGNYMYSSLENFAALGEDGKTFSVYNSRAVKGTALEEGHFFSFNTASQVFQTDENGEPVLVDGKLLPREISGSYAAFINHYFGMTMEVDFQQPPNGKISNAAEPKDMVFEFAGDDDMWIYIDGILVADLGGIHDPIKVVINFSTGEVKIDREDSFGDKTSNTRLETTIKEQFAAAGEDTSTGFKGNTFADNSTHELKMFYMERGNFGSNLALSFNLMEPRNHSLVKVDQNGGGLEGVTFALYEADADWSPMGNAIAVLATSDGGCVDFVQQVNGKETAIAFDTAKKYVLQEVKTLDGFVTTGDIHLTYNEKTQTLNVENQWETGAVSSFEAQVNQAGSLMYADGRNADEDGREGLIIAVPLYNKTNKGDQATEGWQALYGSVTEGFHMVDAASSNDESYRRAALEAALQQLKNPKNERWYLDYVRESDRFEGRLIDLPGSADRYVFINPTEGDMITAYYLLDPSDSIFEGCTTAEQKFDKLAALLESSSVESVVQQYQNDMKLLEISDFNRQFYTRLYIPNQVRELRVHKQDDNGQPLAGAVFTLFSDAGCTSAVAQGITDKDGNLNFSAQNTGNNAVTGGQLSSTVRFALTREDGPSGRQDRSYWLKETQAPGGFALNEAVSEVRITADSIYVNAGSADNGVSVRKGVGRLLQTMVRYAADDELNVTLRDILADKYIQDKDTAGEDLPVFSQWAPAADEEALSLHYGLDSALLDYGLHDPDRQPYFETDSGWMGFGVQQNYTAHSQSKDPWSDAGGIKEDIRNIDISALLTGTTTVVVKDQRQVVLTVEKIIETQAGAPDVSNKAFAFTVVLKAEGAAYTQAVECIRTDAGGTETNAVLQPDQNGTLVFDLKDKEKIAFLLPYGCGYQVLETRANRDGFETTAAAVPQDAGAVIDDQKGMVSDDEMLVDAAVTYTNKQNAGMDFRFTKVASENTEHGLDGAEFTLYELVCGDADHDHSVLIDLKAPGSCWAVKDTQISDPDVTFTGLYQGEEYRLVETKAPEGRVLPAGQWKVTVVVEDAQQKIKIEALGDKTPPAFAAADGGLALPNMRPTDIPGSGSIGTMLFTACGLLLMSGAAAVWLTSRKKGSKYAAGC